MFIAGQANCHQQVKILGNKILIHMHIKIRVKIILVFNPLGKVSVHLHWSPPVCPSSLSFFSDMVMLSTKVMV